MNHLCCCVDWAAGAHINFSKCIHTSISSAISQGMYTFQIFMGNPKSYKRQRITDDDIAKSLFLIEQYPMNIFSHFPYIANLNGKADSLAWNGDVDVDNTLNMVLSELEYELEIMSNFCIGTNRSGVVIHPGCYSNRNAGLLTIAKSINKLKFSDNSMLLLENCAGEGRKLCRNFSEIKVIFDALSEKSKQHVAVCVDTAHIWGQGDYDISKIHEVDRMFMDFDTILGSNKFYLLHLNDSQVKLGSKVDRHAAIGTGYIWGNGNIEPLVYLLNICKTRNIPIVLETTPLDMYTLSSLGY